MKNKSRFFFQVLSVFIEGGKSSFLYLDPTLILVSDAVWQDGEEGSLFLLLFEAEVGVAPVGQTQVNWKLTRHPR